MVRAARTSDGERDRPAINARSSGGGSRREEIVGWLGERLKVKVAAPPEDGRANEAVCRLIATALGVGVRAVSVVSGHSRPEKTLRIEGVAPGALASRLGVADAGGSSR